MSMTSGTLNLPSGKSQRTCTATVGQQPVKRCTWPASLNFSAVVVAAAACWNLPKRVPVLAKPQEGSSMRKPSSAFRTFCSTASAGMVFLQKNFAKFDYIWGRGGAKAQRPGPATVQLAMPSALPARGGHRALYEWRTDRIGETAVGGTSTSGGFGLLPGAQ